MAFSGMSALAQINGKGPLENDINDYLLTATTLTRDVFPAFWSPIKESSISCLKKRLRSYKQYNELHILSKGDKRISKDIKKNKTLS